MHRANRFVQYCNVDFFFVAPQRNCGVYPRSQRRCYGTLPPGSGFYTLGGGSTNQSCTINAGAASRWTPNPLNTDVPCKLCAVQVYMPPASSSLPTSKLCSGQRVQERCSVPCQMLQDSANQRMLVRAHTVHAARTHARTHASIYK